MGSSESKSKKNHSNTSIIRNDIDSVLVSQNEFIVLPDINLSDNQDTKSKKILIHLEKLVANYNHQSSQFKTVEQSLRKIKDYIEKNDQLYTNKKTELCVNLRFDDIKLLYEGYSQIQSIYSSLKYQKEVIEELINLINQISICKPNEINDSVKTSEEPHKINESIYYKSIGLKNLQNSCYMNSVLQCLSNLEVPQKFKYKSSLTKSLINIIEAMKNKNISKKELNSKLIKFHSELIQNEDFPSRTQCDPKYLLIFLQKHLYSENIDSNLFRWIKYVKFIHSLKGAKKTIIDHDFEFPEQTTNIFVFTPQNKYILTLDFIKVLSQFMRFSEVESYCTICDRTVVGQEYPAGFISGKHIIFSISEGCYLVNLQDICTFDYYPYQFKLNSIICRYGSSNNYGHNFAIVKEDERWVIYNDEEVSVLKKNIVEDAYLFIFNVFKII